MMVPREQIEDGHEDKRVGFVEHRILRLVLVLGIASGSTLALVGALLIYIGVSGNAEISFLGQSIKTTNLGIGAMFLGATLCVLTIARGLRSLDLMSKMRSSSAQAPEHVPAPNSDGESSQEIRGGLLKRYAISFLPSCLTDLVRLNLSQEQLIDLVDREFRGHLNYFRFDLEDYAMPVRAQFIVYLSKTGDNLEFRRVLPATLNEAKLVSWNDALALYRRLTRFPYRERPEQLLLREETLDFVLRLHNELRLRLLKHFVVYELGAQSIDWDGVFVLVFFEELLSKGEIPNDPRIVEMMRRVIARIQHSHQSCDEAREIADGLHNGTVIESKALGSIVTCVERSLQHLHKIILEFPPTE